MKLAIQVHIGMCEKSTLSTISSQDGNIIVLNDSVNPDQPQPRLTIPWKLHKVFLNMTLGALSGQAEAEDGCPRVISYKGTRGDAIVAKLLYFCARHELSSTRRPDVDLTIRLANYLGIPTIWGDAVYRRLLMSILQKVDSTLTTNANPKMLMLDEATNQAVWKHHTKSWTSKTTLEQMKEGDSKTGRAAKAPLVQIGLKKLVDEVVSELADQGTWNDLETRLVGLLKTSGKVPAPPQVSVAVTNITPPLTPVLGPQQPSTPPPTPGPTTGSVNVDSERIGKVRSALRAELHAIAQKQTADIARIDRNASEMSTYISKVRDELKNKIRASNTNQEAKIAQVTHEVSNLTSRLQQQDFTLTEVVAGNNSFADQLASEKAFRERIAKRVDQHGQQIIQIARGVNFLDKKSDHIEGRRLEERTSQRDEFNRVEADINYLGQKVVSLSELGNGTAYLVAGKENPSSLDSRLRHLEQTQHVC